MGPPRIIIFDGECNLCNASVRFVIKHDKKAVFLFVHMHTDRAKALLAEYGLYLHDLESVVLIKENKAYLRSHAVFEIMRDLDGMWPLLRVFKLLPSALSDRLYRYIAGKRYAMFGKSEGCSIPSAQIRSRFLQD